MEKLVWSRYPPPARIALTAVLGAAALVCCVNHLLAISAALMLAAAVAFHTEWRLSIDVSARTYERCTLVKPFGIPKSGSIDEIRCIGITMSTSQTADTYFATFVFRPNQFGFVRSFTFSAGTLEAVVADVKKVVDATGIEVIESQDIRQIRQRYQSISNLLGPKP